MMAQINWLNDQLMFMDEEGEGFNDHEMRILRTKYESCQEEMDELCSICFEGFTIGHDIIRLTPCRHVFHVNCIEDWLRIKALCPNCKGNIRQLVS